MNHAGDFVGTVVGLTSSSEWGAYARQLLETGLSRPKEGVDVGDHPPITPVTAARESAKPSQRHSGGLTGDADRLYELIMRHFLATLSPDCIYM